MSFNYIQWLSKNICSNELFFGQVNDIEINLKTMILVHLSEFYFRTNDKETIYELYNAQFSSNKVLVDNLSKTQLLLDNDIEYNMIYALAKAFEKNSLLSELYLKKFPKCTFLDEYIELKDYTNFLYSSDQYNEAVNFDYIFSLFEDLKNETYEERALAVIYCIFHMPLDNMNVLAQLMNQAKVIMYGWCLNNTKHRYIKILSLVSNVNANFPWFENLDENIFESAVFKKVKERLINNLYDFLIKNDLIIANNSENSSPDIKTKYEYLYSFINTEAAISYEYIRPYMNEHNFKLPTKSMDMAISVINNNFNYLDFLIDYYIFDYLTTFVVKHVFSRENKTFDKKDILSIVPKSNDEILNCILMLQNHLLLDYLKDYFSEFRKKYFLYFKQNNVEPEKIVESYQNKLKSLQNNYDELNKLYKDLNQKNIDNLNELNKLRRTHSSTKNKDLENLLAKEKESNKQKDLEIQNLKKELELLNEKIKDQENITNIVNNSEKNDCSDFDILELQSYKWLFNCEDQGIIKELKKMFPDAFYFNVPSGNLTNIQCDYVVHFTKFIGHDMYRKVEEFRKSNNIPVLLFNEKNINLLCKKMQSLILS